MAVAINPSALLPSQQAADFLGTTPGTLAVWRCKRRHDLPYIKIGKSVRYRMADLEAFVAKHTVGEAAS